MSKNRQAVTCNGRASFYASMWEDIRKCAMDNGWAVALHGSLKSDMDIMAMPWTEDSILFEDLITKLSALFSGNMLSEQYKITYNEKPHGRIVATIPIYDDFYLDISTMRETYKYLLIYSDGGLVLRKGFINFEDAYKAMKEEFNKEESEIYPEHIINSKLGSSSAFISYCTLVDDKTVNWEILKIDE